MTGWADDDLESFRCAVVRSMGLHFDDDKLPWLGEVLESRMKSTSCSTVPSYLHRVATASEERAELARALCVSETYFLRNIEQFRVLETLLAERRHSPSRPLRLLSAGCSTGEEAYSLAITVLETIGDLTGWTISILGVDLNPESIAKARQAAYTKWSLRETPEPTRTRYFQKQGAYFSVNDRVRGMVRFEQDNLTSPTTDLWRREAYDVIFFRNVCMYFDRDVARRVLAKMASSLAPGGLLFLGHAENLRGLSLDFRLRQAHNTFYYERRTKLRERGSPAASESTRAHTESPPTVPDDGAWFRAVATATRRIRRLSEASADRAGPANEAIALATPPLQSTTDRDVVQIMDLVKQERFGAALSLLTNGASTEHTDPELLLLHAVLLVSTGDLPKAEAKCEHLLQADNLNAGAHYVLALCREHVGDLAAAEEHLQAAAYLDDEFALPHLHLGRLARRAGKIPAAQREFALALQLLPKEEAARVDLFGGGFGREALVEVCRGELVACGGEK